MTTFSEAHGRKIVSTTTAATVGKVNGFVVDVRGPRVAALEVKKTESGDTLRWDDITGFGSDAVTIAGAEKITDAGEDLAPLQAKTNHVLKKRVLSTTGDELGEVKDVEFDPADGTVIGLVLANGHIAAKRMIGIGSYAVVVLAE